MQDLRKHVVLSIDGGGLRGIICANALRIVELTLKNTIGKGWYELVDLAAGTSTGSIITTALMFGMSTEDIFNLYMQNGKAIFTPTAPSPFDLLTKHVFDNKVLKQVLESHFGNATLADIWKAKPPKIACKDLVVVVRDLHIAQTCFLKSWKDDAYTWTLVDAVLASTAVPTQFPVVNGRYVDGGVGSYSNPVYMAVFEAVKVRGWLPEDVTVISLGTGKTTDTIDVGVADNYHIWDWAPVILGGFLSDASEQQVSMVRYTMGDGLDFRRFQVVFNKEAPDPSATNPKDMPILVKYGEEMARKILADEFEPAPSQPTRAPQCPA